MHSVTTNKTKARYWVGVLYPENMRPDWQDCIGEITQLPGAYCIHDKDKDGDEDERKAHVHIMLAFPNTTTYNTALATLQALSAPGRRACNTVEQVRNVRYKYNYLIHNTEDAKRKGKYQYDVSERVLFNGFDIGCYEQLSLEDKRSMLIELERMLLDSCFVNYADFYEFVLANLTPEHTDVVRGHSGHFARLTQGNWQRMTGTKSGRDNLG